MKDVHALDGVAEAVQTALFSIIPSTWQLVPQHASIIEDIYISSLLIHFPQRDTMCGTALIAAYEGHKILLLLHSFLLALNLNH